jgi:hypothetical protein
MRPDLVWDGSDVTADRVNWLGPAPELVINAPGGIVGTYQAVLGDEPTIIMPNNGVTAGVLDGNTYMDINGEPVDGCVQIEFAADFTGKIVLFDSPVGCSAVFPAFFAQFQSAVGVIIVATTETGLPDVSGTLSNQDITMPYIGVEKSAGVALRANLGTANVTIRNSPTVLVGENAGKVRMYAPAAYESGSSVSHFSTTASPDLLMEPALGTLPLNQVDLTLPAFYDIGWQPNGFVEEIFEDGFEN